jgi:hypothetical protein
MSKVVARRLLIAATVLFIVGATVLIGFLIVFTLMLGGSIGPDD